METRPANPFCAAIDTVKLGLGPPGVKLICAGEMVRAKFGGSVTVKFSDTEWVSEPDVPVIVSGKLPLETATENVTVWLLLAAKLNGKAGEVFAPLGNPEIETVTEPENPFLPTAEIVKLEFELPPTAVRVSGDTLTAKS